MLPQDGMDPMCIGFLGRGSALTIIQGFGQCRDVCLDSKEGTSQLSPPAASDVSMDMSNADLLAALLVAAIP